MRTLVWQRSDLIERVHRDLWRYLTPAADIETEVLEAAALFQMRPHELRTLGSLQFLISDELGALLDYMPILLRQLSTTTAHEEEISTDRIRGVIQWGRTIGLQHATGMPNMYVTAPSRRAFQTPENELLVFLLDQTITLGQILGWERSTSANVGRLVSQRMQSAERWAQSRMLIEIERRAMDPRRIARINTGRFRRRYQPVLDAWIRYNELVGRVDRNSIRRAIETYGLISRSDPTLFELVCTFESLDTLSGLGWRFGRVGLFAGSVRFHATRGGDELELVYQATPKSLSDGSQYLKVQRDHGIPGGGLRPDLVLRHTERTGKPRWLLVEVKGGMRPIEDLARAALHDLLAYRAAFAKALSDAPQPYGLGIAWGADLAPDTDSTIMLCSPDHIRTALAALLG